MSPGSARSPATITTAPSWPPLGIILVLMAIPVVLGTYMEWIAIVFITRADLRAGRDQPGLRPDLVRHPVRDEHADLFSATPFGPACFWLKSVAPEDVTLQEIFASVWPFIGLQIVGLLLVMFFPQIALWLPALLHG